MHIELVAIVVADYDPAIAFFVDALGFELVEDSPSLTNDGRPKRWVVVRPPGAATGILLARADGAAQTEVVGDQFAGHRGQPLGPARPSGVSRAGPAAGRVSARSAEPCVCGDPGSARRTVSFRDRRHRAVTVERAAVAAHSRRSRTERSRSTPRR